MKFKLKSKMQFFIDPDLINEQRAFLVTRFFQEEKIKYHTDLNEINEYSQFVIIGHEKKIKSYASFKNRILVLDTLASGHISSERINLNSYDEIKSFFDGLLVLERHFSITEKIKISHKKYDQIKNLNANEANFFPLDEIFKKELDLHLDLEMNLLKEIDLHSWSIPLKNYIKKSLIFNQLMILTEDELKIEELILDDLSFLFHLPCEDTFLYVRFKHEPYINEKKFLELNVSMILRTLSLLDSKLIKSDGEIDFWKKIFSKIPYPMAAISDLGDLLIYNESFAKIGILPKECLRFKDQESLEIFNQFYKIRKIDFKVNEIYISYFVFYTIESKELLISRNKLGDKRKSVDELGIISSSIAHELNNPLAGILAAISYLQLDDSWADDQLLDLEDMKNGAKRCKELVEIFLGFSKFSPQAIAIPSIKSSLDQAINLLRFRMIESNLRLEVKYTKTLESFSYQINSSVMSMILYLILSELMTAFAHERLIRQSQTGIFSLELCEFSDQIVFKLEFDFEYEDKIAQSKLIQHLLVFEKLEINFLSREMRLIYRG